MLLAVGACGGSARSGDRPENLLLITLDTVRADRIGCYGYESAATPTLDELAQRGALFENCITVAPITLPSHATILTGLLPFRHGVRDNGTYRLPEHVPTLAEILSAQEFDTGAVISAIVLDSRHGLDRGFDSYDDDLSQARQKVDFMFRESLAEDGVRRARSWLDERGDRRWFLWLHLFDAHASYKPPEPFASAHADPYDGEISYADSQIGELLDYLEERGELDETLVVATSDHGEALGDHGEDTHGIFIYDATTRVPLLMSHGSLPAGRRVESVVSSADLMPSMLELLEVFWRGDLDGRSLAALTRGEAPSENHFAYSESMMPLYRYGWSDLRSVRDASGRFVRAPRPEFYDLGRGPETEDLFAAQPELAENHLSVLERMLPAVEADAREQVALDLDPELLSALAQLGYTWGEGADEEPADGARADPKDCMDILALKHRAQNLARRGEFDEAASLLDEALALTPDAIALRALKGKFLRDRGQPREALDELLLAIALPGGDEYLVEVAALERELDIDGWQERVDVAKLIDPHDTRPWVHEGDWARTDGDGKRAQEAYLAALEIDSACSTAWFGLGVLAHTAGDLDLSESHLRKALEHDPQHVGSWFHLSLTLSDLGRGTDARAALERAAELDPTDSRAVLRLGDLLAAAQDWSAAAASYGEAARRSPELFAAHFNQGSSLLRSGKRSEAIACFERAVAIDPDRPQAWQLLMAAQRRSGNAQGALDAALQLLRLNPNAVTPRVNAALACESLGRREEALDHLRQALALDEAGVRARAQGEPELLALLES